MGSSGGGTPRAPKIPPPPAGMIMPQGQTAVGAPSIPSFLPQDPNAMATGLTPEMLAAINAPPPPPVQQAASRDMLAARMSPMRNQYGQLSGQELLMMKMMGKQPQNFDPRAARNDQIMRIFAGSMGQGGQGGGR